MLDRKIQEAVTLNNVDRRYVEFIISEFHRAKVDFEKNRAPGSVHVDSQRTEVYKRSISIVWDNVVFEHALQRIEKRLTTAQPIIP